MVWVRQIGFIVAAASTIHTAFWVASGDWLRMVFAFTKTVVVAAPPEGKALTVQLLSENELVTAHVEPALGVHPLYVKFEFFM